MKLILYKLVIAFVVSECCSQLLFPEQGGCSPQYDYTDDLTKCTHTVYCLNYIPRQERTKHSECQNYVSINGHAHDPLSIILKYDKNHDALPEFKDPLDNQLMYSLDLSINIDAVVVPELKYMPNLVKLKMSKCSLKTAKLSNKNELPAITDIDYSQNNISTIEVVHNEFEYKALKKLNISHNGLVIIPEAIFESFPNIESLDLSYNFLHALDIMYFEGIRKLLHLNLSNNKITNINSSLLRLRYLITLDLSHNILEKLQASDFSKLVNMQELKLDSNKINSIEKSLFENMASLTTVDLGDNDIESIDREMFANATKLSTVYIPRNKLKSVPINMFKGKIIYNFTIEGNKIEGPLKRGTFEGLSMVTELDLSSQSISSVKDYAFAGLQHLETLLLNNNDLESLSNYSFKGLQNLNCLDLSYNRINKLEILTEDLNHLQILTLQHNNIAYISSNNFIALRSLQLLDLSNNNISNMDPISFRSLQRLLNFKISDNPLSGSIEQKTFEGLHSLPSLDISGSLITRVNNGSFMGMTALTDLNISHCNITELQYNSLSYAGKIQAIDLSYNQLSVFDVNTTDLKYLQTLMLNNNMFQVLSQTLFNGLSVLTTVVLSHNQIHTIHKESFYTLKNMRHLDLSYNPEFAFDVSLVKKAQNLAKLYLSGIKADEVTFDNINDIPLIELEMANSGIIHFNRLNLYKLKRLETLLLSNNAASKLEVGTLSNLMYLRNLDISYNDLNYIQPGAFKDNPHLKTLNISHNKLFEINYGIFRGLMSVEAIDLSYNQIKNIHRSRFYGIEHLSSLIVDYNEIEFISDEEFAGTGLSKLSIGGNPLPCEILVSLKKNSYKLRITSINIDLTKENVGGVTCYNKDGYNFNSKLTPKNADAEHDKLLLEIRNILYNNSKQQIVEVNRNDFPYLTNITKQEEILNKHSLEIINSIKNLSSISNLTSIINTNTNLLLGKILRVLSARESIPQTTSKSIILNKENVTTRSLVSYINKIKQDLEDSIAVEKQNILELDDKIAKLNSKQNVTMKPPVHEKLLGFNEDPPKSSLFTEICVGLILMILVGFIVYKVYKSKLYIPSGRSMTSSTRNIAESIESAHL